MGLINAKTFPGYLGLLPLCKKPKKLAIYKQSTKRTFFARHHFDMKKFLPHRCKTSEMQKLEMFENIVSHLFHSFPAGHNIFSLLEICNYFYSV